MGGHFVVQNIKPKRAKVLTPNNIFEFVFMYRKVGEYTETKNQLCNGKSFVH